MYLQVGGFQSHSLKWFGYDKTALVNALMPAPDSTLDLVLGIISSGASYLLLPVESDLWRRLQRAHHLDAVRPYRAADYVSLSPIRFANRAQFTAKLTSLTPKANKKKDRGRPTDTSPANKPFIAAGQDTGPSRAAFEHSRLLLHTLRDRINVRQFGLNLPPGSVHFVTFTFNKWTPTPGDECFKIVDLGWSAFTITPDPASQTPLFTSSVHVRPAEYSKLGVSEKKPAEFVHGTTDVLSDQEIAEKFQTFIEQQPGPIVLLTYDKYVTQEVLNHFKISHHRWTPGLTNFLYPPSSSRDPYRGTSYTYNNDTRRRSRSPQRERDPRRRYESPERRSSSASEVFVVDVRNMYMTLKRSPVTKRMLVTDAVDLGFPANTQEWCAGNESHLLGDMWYSMASGASIDEQFAARWNSSAGTASSSSVPIRAAAFDPDDPDFDPNDVEPMPGGGTAGASGSTQKSLYDDWDATDSEDETGNARYTY